MVGLDGEKMSKSKGNLVLVSKLRESGLDPMVIRLLLLGHHYRSDWQWDEADVAAAGARLDKWRERRRQAGRRPDRARRHRRPRGPGRRTSTPPPPCALLDHWANATDFGDDDRARSGRARSARWWMPRSGVQL